MGAIRWDGWWEGNPWQKNLQPVQWHDRLPFYAKFDRQSGRVTVVSDSAEVMVKEIEYAALGGIDYWAFCYYHPDSWPEADRYNYGWKRHLAAPNRQKVKFAFLLQGGQHLGPKAKWQETCRFFAITAARPEYVQTNDGRPVLYWFTIEYLRNLFGSDDEIIESMGVLNREFAKAGLKPPYKAAQVFSVEAGRQAVEKWGFDAISSYTSPGGGPHAEQSYAQLAAANIQFRDAASGTGHPVIPLVNAGWDGRPRLGDPETAKHYQSAWHRQPTPEELAAHVGRARDWVAENPKLAPSGHLLVYAWNETDEGGWLTPTLKEGSQRIEALRKALGR